MTVTKKECRSCVGNEGVLKVGTKREFPLFSQFLYVASEYRVE